MRRERRAPPGAPGSIRWIKSILGRPIALERRPDGLHVVLADRRRPPEVIVAESIARLREELSSRLLDMERTNAAVAMRHLAFVHDTLGRRGWRGVTGIDSRVLARAIVQLQILIERQPSDRLARLADRLRLLRAAAQVREEQRRSRAEDAPPLPDSTLISEASPEEFEALEREWAVTQPGEPLSAPQPDATGARPAESLDAAR